MRTSSRPGSSTQSHPFIAHGTSPSSQENRALRRFSVHTLLPLSTALLFSLTCAAPGTADVSDPGPGELDRLRVELATARAEVAALREGAAEKIRAYEEESARLDELTGEREAADSRAEAADLRHEGTRLGAARQAASAYKGADLSLMQAWTSPEGPAHALERGSYLVLFGEHRSADLARARASQVATDTLAEAAETAEQEQAETTEAAETARETALEAIEAQEGRTEKLLEQQTRLEDALADTRDPGDEEARRKAALAEAREAVEGTGGAGAGATGGDDAVPVEDGLGGCAGDGAANVENGRVPDTLLCPLPQPGERLRADAAAAFIELDGDFRSEFGRPMCVTDSYRPYHEQVRLFQEMLPGMAARPGTSAHGLGVAVDLCGGVNELGSPEHRWMLDHAPERGWDNPEWARGGFEPWHWEYTP